MSEPNEGANGTGAPAEGGQQQPPEPPPAQPPAPAPPASPQPPPAAAGHQPDPGWLGPRLDQARRSGQSELLRELGVEKPEDLRAKLDQLTALENEKLTEQERVQKRLGELEPQAQKALRYEAVIKERAASELAGLSESQRAAVQKIAGEDAASVLSAIDTLKPTWAAQAAPTNGATEQPASGDAKPADTAPARTAPGDTSTSPPDHKARYEDLKKTNPVQAAYYLSQHSREIYR